MVEVRLPAAVLLQPEEQVPGADPVRHRRPHPLLLSLRSICG
jgi:hypothetical protein